MKTVRHLVGIKKLKQSCNTEVSYICNYFLTNFCLTGNKPILFHVVSADILEEKLDWNVTVKWISLRTTKVNTWLYQSGGVIGTIQVNHLKG